MGMRCWSPLLLIVGLACGGIGCLDAEETPMVIRHRALFAEQRDDFERAIMFREQLMREFPDYFFMHEVHHEQGLAYVAIGDDASAREQFDAAIELDPYYLAPLLARCRLHGRRGDHEQVIADGDRAIELGLENADLAAVLSEQASAFAALGQPQRALTRWELALRAQPDLLPAVRALFRHWMEVREYDVAAELLADSLDVNDRVAEKHLMLAQLHVARGETDAATAALERARELNVSDELEVPEHWADLAVIEPFERAPGVATPTRLSDNEAPETVPNSVSDSDAASVRDFARRTQSLEIARKFLENRGYTDLVADLPQQILTARRADQEFEFLVTWMSPDGENRFRISADNLATITATNPPRGMIVIADLADQEPAGVSGRVAAFAESWQPDPSRLRPLEYTYEIPSQTTAGP